MLSLNRKPETSSNDRTAYRTLLRRREPFLAVEELLATGPRKDLAAFRTPNIQVDDISLRRRRVELHDLDVQSDWSPGVAVLVEVELDPVEPPRELAFAPLAMDEDTAPVIADGETKHELSAARAELENVHVLDDARHCTRS
jgi:hypothetical protein